MIHGCNLSLFQENQIWLRTFSCGANKFLNSYKFQNIFKKLESLSLKKKLIKMTKDNKLLF